MTLAYPTSRSGRTSWPLPSAAETTLRSHGYGDVERSVEILHVALEDVRNEHDDELN